MPPKKEAKEKQIKGDEADELVLQYLKSVNRPYASTDVSANLKNKVTKVAAQKILQALAEKGDLTVKTYGKQTIFVYNQDKIPVMSSDEMASTDAQFTELTEELKAQKEQQKVLEKVLSALPKTKDLPADIERIQGENALTAAALAPYRGTSEGEAIQPLSTAEIKVIDDEFVKWRKEWTNRRKVYQDLLGMLLDSGSVKAEDFEDEQGITLDDEEARAIEQGEFCKPPARVIASRPQTSSKKPPIKTSSAVAASKTTVTVSSIAPSSKKRVPSAALTVSVESQDSSQAQSDLQVESQSSEEPPVKRSRKKAVAAA